MVAQGVWYHEIQMCVYGIRKVAVVDREWNKMIIPFYFPVDEEVRRVNIMVFVTNKTNSNIPLSLSSFWVKQMNVTSVNVQWGQNQEWQWQASHRQESHGVTIQLALETRSDIPDNREVGFRPDWPDFIVDEVENKRLGWLDRREIWDRGSPNSTIAVWELCAVFKFSA